MYESLKIEQPTAYTDYEMRSADLLESENLESRIITI